MDYILFGFDSLVGGKHHWMSCDAVNKYQINIFSGCSNLYSGMGKVCFMVFAFVKDIHLNLSLPAVTQFGSHCPFVVVQELAVRFQADYIILPQSV